MSPSLSPNLPALPTGSVVSALMQIQMKNLDAMATAQKAVLEGMGTLARQQQDMLAASLKEFTASPPSLLGSDPRAAVAKPFDAMRSALLDGTARGNLITQIAAQSNATVAGILQDRMLAALEETKAALLAALPAAAKA
ncbi:phasin family protein [Paracraurococcus lichenis]|uniref:Phasin family protein n=1 Tax=Paracraurococcus lichenis TaxID=3064888 RepID=A0ABT9DX09_9PROT|nr:phasin family protein [Paracraurococcus sp. LOR1-02]MDO9708423.1 phasin family protein [Paracraurococcus sp. LOR1-02]